MIRLPYSLVIEGTEEADFFGFYSPDLEGFTGKPNESNEKLLEAIQMAWYEEWKDEYGS